MCSHRTARSLLVSDRVLRRHRESVYHRVGAYWYLRGIDVGPGARVWGRPVIDAQDLEIGSRFVLHSQLRTTRLAGVGAIRIGDGVFMNHGSAITARTAVTIGNDVALSQDVAIMDNNAHGLAGGPIVSRPVTVEDGAWIGLRAILLPGVTIGALSVVAAGSVVTKSMPPRTLVAGNPARPIREIAYPPGVHRAWHGGAQ